MRALVVKACIGAGLPVGVADEWARACATSPEILDHLVGALANEAALPFLRHASALLALEAMGEAVDWPTGRDEALLAALAAPEEPMPSRPLAPTLHALDRLAAATLVPVGEDSLDNAGAGLTDND